MSNKYLEKIAKRDNHMIRGTLVGPYSQERAIAKDHGVYLKPDFKKNEKQDFNRGMNHSDNVLRDSGLAAHVGAFLGTVGAPILSKGKISPWKGAAGGALTGLVAGSTASSTYHNYQHAKQHAKEMHKKYANADISEVQGIDYNTALGRILSKA